MGTPENCNLRGLGVLTPHLWKLHITSQMLFLTFVMDRGYIDFERLFVFTLCSAFFEGFDSQSELLDNANQLILFDL